MTVGELRKALEPGRPDHAGNIVSADLSGVIMYGEVRVLNSDLRSLEAYGWRVCRRDDASDGFAVVSRDAATAARYDALAEAAHSYRILRGR